MTVENVLKTNTIIVCHFCFLKSIFCLFQNINDTNVSAMAGITKILETDNKNDTKLCMNRIKPVLTCSVLFSIEKNKTETHKQKHT